MTDILQAPGRPIAYHPSLARITGSVKAAILLQQIVYWTPRAKDEEGWIYKSQATWMQETGFTAKEFRGALDDLETTQVVRREYDRSKHSFRLMLRIEEYNAAIQAMTGHVPKGHVPKGHVPKGHVPKGQVACAKRASEPAKRASAHNMYRARGDYTEITTEIRETTSLSSDPPKTNSADADASALTTVDALTVDALIDGWNYVCGTEGLPQVTARGRQNKSFREKIKLRLREQPDLGFWNTVFNHILHDKFYRGEGPRGWKCDLYHLVANDRNAIKIFERAPP